MQLKEIDKRIGQLRGMVNDLMGFIAATAVGIVDHYAEHGDCSRAGKLVAALPNSMQRTYLIRWFEKAGIAIDTNNGYASKAISKDSKRYRSPSEGLEFAKANNWFDAVNEKGERALWYQGPTPREQEPNTIMDFTDNVIGFADRTAKSIRTGVLTKTVNGKRVNVKDSDGNDVPLYNLTADQRQAADKVLGAIRRFGLALKAPAYARELEGELARINSTIEEATDALEGAPSYDDVKDIDVTKTGTNG
jgi:hypothetical protein